MTPRNIKAAAALGIISLVSAPTVATATAVLRSVQGSDYSVNAANGTTIYACDLENDENDVSADFVRVGSAAESHVVDAYGGNCSSTGASAPLYKHRAVELVRNWVDNYGPWVYPR